MDISDGVTNDPVVFSEVLNAEDCFKSRENLMKNKDSNMKTDMAEVNLCKSPKRVLHFSDGVIEEYSSDDDECDGNPTATCSEVNPKMLTWVPWTWYYVSTAGWKTLKVCDYLGESLANFFGITSPKYQYEIEEYYRCKAEEEEHRKQQDLEMRGWTDNKPAGDDAFSVEVVEPRPKHTVGQVGQLTLPSSESSAIKPVKEFYSILGYGRLEHIKFPSTPSLVRVP